MSPIMGRRGWCWAALGAWLVVAGCDGDVGEGQPDPSDKNRDGGLAQDGAGGSDAQGDAQSDAGDIPDGGPGGSVDSDPGAHLPIEYDLDDVAGTKWFVAPEGSAMNTGTEASPITLAAAISKVGSGQSATIIVRGGTYSDDGLLVSANRTVHIKAYPGEVPVFRGSQALDGTWTTEGAYAWHAYAPIPVTDGGGVSLSTGQNLTGSFVGRHPDQAWIGDVELRQVATQVELAAGRFWVDAANGRLYLMAADAGMPDIEASRARRFVRITGAGSTLEGLRIERYSNTASDYGVVLAEAGAAGFVMRHVEIIDAALQAVHIGGGAAPIMDGARIENVTITSPNWMGVTASKIDDLVFNEVKFTTANTFDEFTHSPVSGAIKMTRCHRTRIYDSEFSGNHSHGVWFDASNYDADVVGNRFINNDGSAFFYEISDDLLFMNNYVRATGSARGLKLAGSSGLKLLNNTVVGTVDPVSVNTDSRSIPGCADASQPACDGVWSGNREDIRERPTTLDWMPRLDLMLNNILVFPTGAGYCGQKTAVCITSTNGDASAPIETILHDAEPGRGIPETVVDGNVYANGGGSLVRTAIGNYATVAAWTAAAAAAPISLTGIDAQSQAGDSLVMADGRPTNELDHDDAVPVPADAELNQYVAAGTRHYGWFR